MTNLAINGILEKMTGKDKDYRYMATSDLLNELSKEGYKADADLEIKVSNTVLHQLDDAAGDVSGLAVKCLAPLVKKVSEDRVLEMTEKLCDKLLNGKDQNRDIASIALKTIVSEVTTTAVAQRLLVSLSPQLVLGITSAGMSTEVKCECLDILCDVLHRFGNLMTRDHELLLRALLSQLSSNQASVRKKSISCIASLASSLSDDLLAKATVEVVQLLKNRGPKPEMTRTNIQMIGALSRSVGYRFGPHLGDTVPLLINYCTSASENDEELREYSLQALDSFLLRCPRDISPYCDDILHLTLEFLSYDPNFTDNMEEDTDDESHEEEEEDESADEYTDDEDISWKVRRAAAKCLAAVIVSRPEMLSKLYKEACPKLIERFKEREENVKMDVFNTFIELLRQTGNVTKGQTDTNELSPRWLLKQDVPKIVKSINRQLREKSIKTKVGAFSVLKELVIVLPDCLADHIGSLVSGIEKALNDKSSTSNLKIEALTFTRLVMASHSPSVFHPFIKALSGPVLTAVSERYYKVTAEALRVCGELVRVVRPNFKACAFNFKPYVHPIYNAILTRLANQDQDQEVKECAISCMGLVISTFGDNLQAELPACLPVLVDRMGNEITRLTAVKAFAEIAGSPLKIDLSCVLEHVVAELTAFLRKANRALRQATLGTLNSLVVAYGDRIGSSAYEVIIVELSTLISDSDLHMTALALELCCTLMDDRKSNQNVGLTVTYKVLPQALILIRSSLLQGQALQALQSFFAALVQSANTSFDALLDSLLSSAKPSPQSGGLAKQALYSVAQCVAVLCLAAGNQKCAPTVEMLTNILKDDSSTNSAKQHLALLCLGEIGRRKDLSSHAHIENIVIESFQSPFEEIKSAASYALGNIAVGNLSKYLPFILDQIDNQQKKQYLLLHSLKEVIARQSVDKAGQAEFQDTNVEKILKLLFNHCESEEEGVRNVVAECLGKIALIEPKKLVPALKVRTTSPTSFTRATVVIAVKYSIVERPERIDDIIFPEISSFLMLIRDDDRHVRRAAVLALSTAAHNKPNLIKGLLPELLPLLYDQTVVKQELIRTVDLGPFKHIVDDGLELRKAAFECVDTLLDSCLDQVNPSSFIVPYLKSGLDDHYDVKMPCHLILSKLADKCPAAVLAVLDSLVDPLEKTINHRPKQDAVKQEVDRNEDMIRSALRAIASLNRISFIVSFSFHTANSENDSKRLQDFLLTMETTIRDHPLWIGATEEEIDSAIEGLEKFVMTKLFSRTFVSTPEDAKCDQEISEKIHLLQNFLRPEHLDIPSVFRNEASWLLAEKELQKINACKAPREKLLCILNCCRVINNLLLNVSMSADHVPAGADDFLPVLIYITIKANPPQLHSNLKFVQLYRRQSKLISEAAYYFTNLVSAESFIVGLDAKSLSMDESDFHKSMQDARSLANEERWIELGPASAGKSESVDPGPTIKYWDKKNKMGGEKYPFMEAEAGELTVGDVEKLLSVYKDVVTKYSRLSKAMRDLSLVNEEASTPLPDANLLQKPEAEPSNSIEHNKEDR